MESKFDILIVDDNAELASSLQDVMEAEGYSAAVALDGETALTKLRENAFKMGIIDIKLPDMSGMDLTEKMIELVPGVEYIIITGYASLDTAVKAASRRPVVAYVTKPLDMGHLLALIRQVAERRKAEEELCESEGRFRNLVLNLTDLVMEIDSEGKFTYVSPQIFDIFGYMPEESVGLYAFEFVHPDDIPRCMEAMASMKQVAKLEYRSRHKDGHYVHVSTSSKIVPDGYGGSKIISVLRDITEQKKMEKVRKELERKAYVSSRLTSIGEMASGIAHEINNPLTSVIGFAHLLMERKDVPDDSRKALEIIDSGSVRVADIVRRLLTFARQDRAEREYVRINGIIENTLALRAYAMKTGNIEARTYFDPELPCTMADGAQLQQVFLNIIINAETEMKRAHGKGSLLIKTEVAGETIRVSFKDDGPGIAPEDMDRIFEPFFTTMGVGEGMGLGLSICHGIIAQHRGHLYARSELGQGATFIVELPVVAEEKKPELAEPVAYEARKVTGAKILVVDDEPTILRFLSQILTDEGHRVEAVDNAAEALEKIKSERYNLILLDIKLPGMSGMELYENIRRMARTLARRVIFITGDVMAADTRNFLSRAGAPYISKPFNIKQLKESINHVLEGGKPQNAGS